MNKARLLAGCAIAFSSSAAWAQAVPASQPAPVGPAASTTEVADIVVTAQKRSQKLQEVPAAISSIGGSALQTKGIFQTTDLSGSVPSLQVTTAFGNTEPNFSLRGISVANDFTTATASPVGVYVDEVYQSFRASHGQQLYDMDRIEVLRGPQGTLYGRNTTGGAISFFTSRPSLSGVSGNLTVGYGNYATKTAEGAVDFTLVPDTLGIRFAGTIASGDGWQYNVFDHSRGGSTDSSAFRTSLRWRPTAKLEINAKGYWARDDPRSQAPYIIGHLAGNRDILGYYRGDPQAILNGGFLSPDEINDNTLGHSLTESAGGALNIKYDLTDNITVTSITGYDWGHLNLAPTDCDGSPNSLCNNEFEAKSDNFNQDLRFNVKADRLNLVAGLYYGVDQVVSDNHPTFFGVLQAPELAAGLPGGYNNIPIATPDSIRVLPAFALNPSLTPSSPGYCAPVTVNPNGFFDARTLLALLADTAVNDTGASGPASAACAAAGAPPISPIYAEQKFTIRRPSEAIYGDATYDITDKLSGSIGLRYSWDKVEFLNARTTLRSLDGKTIVASTIPYSYPYNPNLPALNEENSTERLTGRANISYKFTRDIMGYVNFSRGYRSGNYNGFAYQGVNQVYFVPPEKVNAYEAGLKTRFFDRHVILNLAGYYYDYSNQQVIQIVGAAPFARSANGHIFGGEAELTWQILHNLRFNGSVGILRSEYTGNTPNPSDPTSPTYPVNGNSFPNAPDTTFAGTVDWDLFNNEHGKMTLTGNTTYQGKYYYDSFGSYGQHPCNAPLPGTTVLQASSAITCGNPGYWLFDGRLNYTTGRYSIAVWVKNIFDKYYYTYGINIAAFQTDYLNRGMPRTFGVQTKVTF